MRATVRVRSGLPTQQQIGHARLEREQRAPSGFGGMRGEHGSDVELDDGVEHFIGRVSRLAQRAHGPACGGGLRCGIRVPRV